MKKQIIKEVGLMVVCLLMITGIIILLNNITEKGIQDCSKQHSVTYCESNLRR